MGTFAIIRHWPGRNDAKALDQSLNGTLDKEKNLEIDLVLLFTFMYSLFFSFQSFHFLCDYCKTKFVCHECFGSVKSEIRCVFQHYNFIPHTKEKHRSIYV